MRKWGWLLCLAGAVAFGAADQWIGGRYSAFATTVSVMSAPWLLIAFGAGATRRGARRAALLGLAVTLAALSGYMAIMWSPIEGVHPTIGLLESLVPTQWRNIVGGLVTGPVYGFLGERWRTRKSWPSAALAAGPLLLEPVASHLGLTHAYDPRASLAEVAAGLLLALALAVSITRSPRSVRA